ncbi:MAG: DMT family transporter [Peptococcaceae bacterium]|nr:DMT family transporter [Peptococcaceae bacterium]
MQKRHVYILMLLATVVWSGAFITGKISIREFSPISLTFLRFLFTLPVIFTILYLKHPEDWIPKRKEWLPLGILGLIGTFGYHVFFFTALRYTQAVNASLIGATNPMVTTFLAIVFLREKLTPMRALGILLSFTGVFFIVTNGDWQALRSLRFNFGDLIMFTAVWFWASYAVISRVFMQKYQLEPLKVTAYTFFTCTVVSFPLVLLEAPWQNWLSASGGAWLSILYMSLFASIIGYGIQLIGIQHIGAARAAIFINIVPAFVIIESIVFLGEIFSWFKAFSAGVIILGVYLASRSETEPSKHKANNIKQ